MYMRGVTKTSHVQPEQRLDDLLGTGWDSRVTVLSIFLQQLKVPTHLEVTPP